MSRGCLLNQEWSSFNKITRYRFIHPISLVFSCFLTYTGLNIRIFASIYWYLHLWFSQCLFCVGLPERAAVPFFSVSGNNLEKQTDSVASLRIISGFICVWKHTSREIESFCKHMQQVGFCAAKRDWVTHDGNSCEGGRVDKMKINVIV